MKPIQGRFFGLTIALFFSISLTVMQFECSLGHAATWESRPSWAKSYPNQNVRKNPYQEEKEVILKSPFSPGTNNLSIDVGQVFLMGSISGKYNDNLGFQAHYNYGVSEMFAFDASFGHSNHSEGDFSMTSLKSGLRVNLSWFDKIVPHAVFGLGFYRPSVDIFDAEGNKTDNLSPILFGIHVGPGIDLLLTERIFFGTQIMFHDIFGAKKKTEAGELIDVGGTFTTFMVKAGVTF